MKIEKIEIKGLFGKKDICWQLNPQVNVLVGVNGSGKSTILGIVYNMFEKYFTQKYSDRFHTGKLLFKHRIIREMLPMASYTEFLKAKGVLINEELNKKLIREDRDLNKFNFYIDLIEANLTNSNANHIIQRSNQETTNALDMEIRDTIHEFNKIKTDELMNQLTGSLNVFFNQIGKSVSYENHELVYTDTQLQKKLNYSHLSSGERQLIYILLRVALSNGDKSKTAIILMDEPEISLHLDWQEHFIKQLTILNPDAQFIIVTHSPALIMNGWNDVYVDMEEITTWQ